MRLIGFDDWFLIVIERFIKRVLRLETYGGGQRKEEQKAMVYDCCK